MSMESTLYSTQTTALPGTLTTGPHYILGTLTMGPHYPVHSLWVHTTQYTHYGSTLLSTLTMGPHYPVHSLWVHTTQYTHYGSALLSTLTMGPHYPVHSLWVHTLKDLHQPLHDPGPGVPDDHGTSEGELVRGHQTGQTQRPRITQTVSVPTQLQQ